MKRIVSIVLLALAAATPAVAADYPLKPVRIVVPWAPGGFTDTLGRLLAEKMTRAFGQTVLVDNRPGASGAIGSDFVAKQPPDGYTLLITTSDSVVRLLKDKTIDALRDFSHVSLVATQPVLLGVGANVPAKNVTEFVAMARERQGKVSYASSGEGSAVHLAMELFAKAAGVKMIHVPYKGIAPALTDVLGGQVEAIFISFQSSGGNFKTGKLKPLAITSRVRSAIAPEVPTLAESGYPDFVLTLWYGLTGPRGMPQPVIDALNREVRAAIAAPDVRERLTSAATDPVGSSAEELRKFTADEVAKWSTVVN